MLVLIHKNRFNHDTPVGIAYILLNTWYTRLILAFISRVDLGEYAATSGNFLNQRLTRQHTH